MNTIKWLFSIAVLGLVGGIAFLYSGVYPMGADVPHHRATYWALETLRERSISRSIRDIRVPPLNDPARILAGAADYEEMCSGCHLKPGVKDSEMTLGLYPQPPNLSDPARISASADAMVSQAREFWIIKHGIKASGMAAFGKTHDDERIWAMVAFIQKLPTSTPAQYQTLTARPEGEPAGHHAHDEGDH